MFQDNQEKIAQLHDRARLWLQEQIETHALQRLLNVLENPHGRGFPLESVLWDISHPTASERRLQIITNLTCIAPLKADDQQMVSNLIDRAISKTCAQYVYRLHEAGDSLARVKLVDLLCTEVLPLTDELRLRYSDRIPDNNVKRFRQPKLVWPTDVAALQMIQDQIAHPEVSKVELDLILDSVTNYMNVRQKRCSALLLGGQDEKTQSLVKLQQNICHQAVKKRQEQLIPVKPPKPWTVKGNLITLAFGSNTRQTA